MPVMSLSNPLTVASKECCRLNLYTRKGFEHRAHTTRHLKRDASAKDRVLWLHFLHPANDGESRYQSDISGKFTLHSENASTLAKTKVLYIRLPLICRPLCKTGLWSPERDCKITQITQHVDEHRCAGMVYSPYNMMITFTGSEEMFIF